jgi:DNA primase
MMIKSQLNISNNVQE